MRTASGCLLLLGMILVLDHPARAADEPKRKDAFGDPLPIGAIARLGTARFRIGGAIAELDLAPDGLTFAETEGGDVCLRSARTGQLLRHWRLRGNHEKDEW